MFTQVSKGSALEHTYYRSVPHSMLTLVLRGVLPDMTESTLHMAHEHPLFAVLFLFFVVLTFITIMNMLIGVLVEVVSVVASVEKESNQVSSVKKKLMLLLQDMGIQDVKDIDFGKDEFKQLLNEPKSAKAMFDVGVDALALVDSADYIFRDADTMSFEELLSLLLQLRGNNAVKVKDLVDMRTSLHWELQRHEQLLEQICQNCGVRGAAGFISPRTDRDSIQF